MELIPNSDPLFNKVTPWSDGKEFFDMGLFARCIMIPPRESSTKNYLIKRSIGWGRFKVDSPGVYDWYNWDNISVDLKPVHLPQIYDFYVGI